MLRSPTSTMPETWEKYSAVSLYRALNPSCTVDPGRYQLPIRIVSTPTFKKCQLRSSSLFAFPMCYKPLGRRDTVVKFWIVFFWKAHFIIKAWSDSCGRSFLYMYIYEHMLTLEALIIVGRRVPQIMASYVSFVRCFLGINYMLMELATFWRN